MNFGPQSLNLSRGILYQTHGHMATLTGKCPTSSSFVISPCSCNTIAWGYTYVHRNVVMKHLSSSRNSWPRIHSCNRIYTHVPSGHGPLTSRGKHMKRQDGPCFSSLEQCQHYVQSKISGFSRSPCVFYFTH